MWIAQKMSRLENSVATRVNSLCKLLDSQLVTAIESLPYNCILHLEEAAWKVDMLGHSAVWYM
jgi:hypothetical protein